MQRAPHVYMCLRGGPRSTQHVTLLSFRVLLFVCVWKCGNTSGVCVGVRLCGAANALQHNDAHYKKNARCQVPSKPASNTWHQNHDDCINQHKTPPDGAKTCPNTTRCLTPPTQRSTSYLLLARQCRWVPKPADVCFTMLSIRCVFCGNVGNGGVMFFLSRWFCIAFCYVGGKMQTRRGHGRNVAI